VHRPEARLQAVQLSSEAFYSLVMTLGTYKSR
jgi:hypothetical protein